MKLYFLVLLLISLIAPQYASATNWNGLISKSLMPAIILKNKAIKDIYGEPEFVTSVDFIPYSKDHKPIESVIPIRFRASSPVSSYSGNNIYFARAIPLVYLNDAHLDLEKVAYFKIHIQVIEVDLFSDDILAQSEVILYPQGLVKAVNATHYYKKMNMKLKVKKSQANDFTATAFWEIKTRPESLVEKAKKLKKRLEI